MEPENFPIRSSMEIDNEIFASTVKYLDDLFGAATDLETIHAVVLKCNGDVQKAIEEMVEMVGDGTSEKDKKTVNEPAPAVAYSAAIGRSLPVSETVSAESTSGAIAKTTLAVATNPLKYTEKDFSEINSIIDYINMGWRLLILMRGLPGSGKTFLAKYIINNTVCDHPRSYICSTDDYFIRGKKYVYNVNDLSSAHSWNQDRVINLLSQGISPVIVDNTNLEMWEMKPYIASAIGNGYEIKILEPPTSWGKNVRELSQRNLHGVHAAKIKYMLDKYESGVTLERIKITYNLVYPSDLNPPVPRILPILPKKIVKSENVASCQSSALDETYTIQNQLNSKPTDEFCIKENNGLTNQMQKLNCNSLENDLATDFVMKTEELKAACVAVEGDTFDEPLPVKWSDGEAWTEVDKNVENITERDVDAAVPKPQRPRWESKTTTSADKDVFLKNFEPFTDWKTIENQWNSYEIGNNTSWKTITKPTQIKTQDCWTNTHMGEFVSFSDKILHGHCREINDNYCKSESSKLRPPLVLRLEKSSMTEDIEEVTQNEEVEDENFVTFRNMFLQISEINLKDIYDKCSGDLNWAIETVLDGDSNNSNLNFRPVLSPPLEPSKVAIESLNVAQNARFKFPKNKCNTETSLQLKRELEQNFTIPDNLYSEHCLKIRKLRRGEPLTDSDSLDVTGMQTNNLTECQGSISGETVISDESDLQEQNHTMYMGTRFITQLDVLFGMEVEYPDTIMPVVSMPMSLLRQIHALWMESLTHQIEVKHELSDVLLKEDNDFSRKLIEKEKEQSEQGLPPPVPNLQEIMDMEYAFALSNAELKALNESGEDDLATKLSKQKLLELFPALDRDTIFEIFAAHSKKFDQTVEVLMLSCGMTDGSEGVDAVKRLISERELQLKQAKLLEKAQQEISKDVSIEDDDDNEDVDKSHVDYYRDLAKKHLNIRNRYQNQAQVYFQKGMLQVATYYSQIATLHKKKYDLANSMAANSLIKMHSSGLDRDTLDLHYLYVAEALETLDLFLDRNISELATSVANGPYSIKQRSLYLITGRGVHSRGGPRVKPAVRKRLKQRSIRFAEVNGGLLSVTVNNADKLTDQL